MAALFGEKGFFFFLGTGVLVSSIVVVRSGCFSANYGAYLDC
jgi:hypothetical protein